MFNLRLFILITLVLGSLYTANSITLAQAPAAQNNGDRERGIQLYRANSFVEAAKVLKASVKKNATDELAWHYLGLALAQQPKELKNASKAFETAIKLRPDFAAAHASLSYVLLLRNKSSEALREAQSALAIEPGIASAHHVVSVVRLNAGAFEEALTAAKEAIKLNPNLAAAYLVKSEALWGIYAGPAKIAFLTRPAAAVPPTAEQLEERREKRRREAAMLTESAESLETYLKLNPTDPSAALWRQQLLTLKVLGNVGKKGGEVVKYGDEVTSKARVLSKPEPHYTDAARQAQIKGTVVLRAVLSADGRVRNIMVIKALPYGLTEEALSAARGIRFTPAMVDGVPVSMFVQLEYNFNLY